MPNDEARPCCRCGGTGEEPIGDEALIREAMEKRQDANKYGWGIPANQRTVAQILACQGSVYSCCDEHADRSSCDCLEIAQRYEDSQTKATLKAIKAEAGTGKGWR